LYTTILLHWVSKVLQEVIIVGNLCCSKFALQRCTFWLIGKLLANHQQRQAPSLRSTMSCSAAGTPTQARRDKKPKTSLTNNGSGGVPFQALPLGGKQHISKPREPSIVRSATTTLARFFAGLGLASSRIASRSVLLLSSSRLSFRVASK
jgi:hypothetical protein